VNLRARLVPYLLLGLLALGTGLGIGLGLSEAPSHSAPSIVVTPKLIPAKDHYSIAVWMKVGAMGPQIAIVRAALHHLPTTSSCGFLSTQAQRKTAREILAPRQFATPTPADFAASIHCLVTQLTPATKSTFDRLSRQRDVREVQVSYLGPPLPPHPPAGG
jgi:hypothetical protein